MTGDIKNQVVPASPKTRAAIVVLRASLEEGVSESLRVHVLVVHDVALGHVVELTVSDVDAAVRAVQDALATFAR